MKKNSFQRFVDEASLEMKSEGTVDERSTTSLDQRTLILLRALHGRDDFSEDEFRTARSKILDEMATDVLRGSTSNDPPAGPRPSLAPSPHHFVYQRVRDFLANEFGDNKSRVPATWTEFDKFVGSLRPPTDADADAARAPPEPRASQRPPEASRNPEEIRNAVLTAIQDALNIPDSGAHLAERPVEALAERPAEAFEPMPSVGDAPGDVETALDDLIAPPSAQLLGWRLLDARPQEGLIKVGFDGKREFCNRAGFVQGGLLSAMLDSTMGAAVIVMSEGRLYTSTVRMTVNFLVPARPGPIVAEAKVTQLGKTLAFVEGKLLAQDGTLLATATASERLLEAKAVQA
jgi:uncharacterized protein (TIGR00369 family)